MVLNSLWYVNESSLSSSSNSLFDAETMGGYSEQNERTVYLGDLDLDVSERQIDDFFHSIHLKPVKVVKQPHSSFAHVTFDNSAIARLLLDKAILPMQSRIVRVMPFNQPNNFDPNANLIIKNLESYLNELHIIHKFKSFGDILSCKLVRDSAGESKCYAYLQFKDARSASQAIDNLNNTYWDEKFDPDFHYQKYKDKLNTLKLTRLAGKLFSEMTEAELFAEFNSKIPHGKKIYVGIFKKKEEYSKIKQEKEGKPSNLYVKNFGPDFGDRDLFNLFKTFGSIKSAKVRRQKYGMIEKPLGCGFVDFENPDDAERARLSLNGYVLKDSNRVISVSYADCKSRRMRKKLEETEVTTVTAPQPHSPSYYCSDNEVPVAVSPPVLRLMPHHHVIEPMQYDDCKLSDCDDEERMRSVSTSSETSFDSILCEWSERWNRQLYSEYKLFY